MQFSCAKWIRNAARFVGTVTIVLASTANADVGPTISFCNACHGPNGVSMMKDSPTLAGISSFVLENYIIDYRDELRPCKAQGKGKMIADMCALVKNLSDEQIVEVAAFYAAVDFKPAGQQFEAEKAAAGEKIHKAKCERCHTDGGTNADDDSSLLGGQWMPYLQEAIMVFRSGERVPMEAKMKEKIDTLDDDQADALIHYYGSLQ